MATGTSEAKVTTDHDEIRRWVEERGGHPAEVKGTELLRIDYPGFSGEERLEEIGWDDFSLRHLRRTTWRSCIRRRPKMAGRAGSQN